MTAIKTDKLRYRAYYWLINASFFSIVVGLTSEIVEAFTGYDAFGMSNSLQTAIGFPLAILAIFVPVALIAIASWRDEYAESVWKRTVGLMAIFFTVGPFLLGLFLFAAYAVIGGEEPPEWLDWLYGERRSVEIVLYSWYVFNAAYVVIFQIIRWWDAR